MSTGVLLMGFGGPDSLAAVAPFMANLMGREPSPEAVQRATRRYLTIGGASPLPLIAREIAGKLSEKLTVPVAVGMRYWDPYMADGLAELAAAGVDRVVAVSLSPFESRHSAGGYRTALAEAAGAFPDMTIVEAPSFRNSADFLMALADALDEALADLPQEAKRRAVLFTAHSLPVADLGEDPYVEELRETAAEVAARVGLARASESGRQGWLKHVDGFGSGQAPVPWLVAYQSKGQRGGEWLEPDIAGVIQAMADDGYEGVAVSAIGFATDHMETLYDLDVEAAGQALDLDMEFQRARVPNDSPRMIDALASVVEPLL